MAVPVKVVNVVSSTCRTSSPVAEIPVFPFVKADCITTSSDHAVVVMALQLSNRQFVSVTIASVGVVAPLFTGANGAAL